MDELLQGSSTILLNTCSEEKYMITHHKCTNAARIITDILKANKCILPVVSVTDKGYVDLTWYKKLYCTIEYTEGQLECLITSVLGPNFRDVVTETIIIEDSDGDEINKCSIDTICSKIIVIITMN